MEYTGPTIRNNPVFFVNWKKGKAMQDQPLHIISGGRRIWVRSTGYQKQVKEIKENVSAKYSGSLIVEKNLIKRLFLVIGRSIEVYKKISELRSYKNLHLSDPAV